MHDPDLAPAPATAGTTRSVSHLRHAVAEASSSHVFKPSCREGRIEPSSTASREQDTVKEQRMSMTCKIDASTRMEDNKGRRRDQKT